MEEPPVLAGFIATTTRKHMLSVMFAEADPLKIWWKWHECLIGMVLETEIWAEARVGRRSWTSPQSMTWKFSFVSVFIREAVVYCEDASTLRNSERLKLEVPEVAGVLRYRTNQYRKVWSA